MHQISLPIYPNYHILNKVVSKHGIKFTIMIGINEEEEEKIDNINKEIITFNRGNRSFAVTMKDIYCYGEVNFKDIETVEKINSFDFLDYLDFAGIRIPSNYDYDTHSYSTPKSKHLYTETFSPAKLATIAHGYLGKPQRILLFNQVVRQW